MLEIIHDYTDSLPTTPDTPPRTHTHAKGVPFSLWNVTTAEAMTGMTSSVWAWEADGASRSLKMFSTSISKNSWLNFSGMFPKTAEVEQSSSAVILSCPPSASAWTVAAGVCASALDWLFFTATSAINETWRLSKDAQIPQCNEVQEHKKTIKVLFVVFFVIFFNCLFFCWFISL